MAEPDPLAMLYAMMAAQQNSPESRRQRLTGGDTMFDSDVYTSPFAPRSGGGAPVGLTGDPAIANGGGSVFSPMMPPPFRSEFDKKRPFAPDANQITPEMQPEMLRALAEALMRKGI